MHQNRQSPSTFSTAEQAAMCAMQEARNTGVLLEAGAGEEAVRQPQSGRSPAAACRTASVKRCGLTQLIQLIAEDTSC